MQQMHKRVASVTPEVLCGETTAAQVTTDTVIGLDNTGDFYEDGGSVLIDGTVYTYSAGAVEEGEDDDTPAPSITLDSGLVGNLPAGSLVEVWNPGANGGAGAVAVDYMVEVTDDTDGSPGIAYLRHDLIPYLSEGLPVGVGDSVTVEVDEFGDWWVVNIHGREALLNGEHIDATTIPTQVPTAIPAESPSVVATGLADWIVLQTEELDAATTLLTFQISLDGSAWDDLNDEPVGSRVRVVKTLADGETPLAVGTVYQFRTIASNIIGTAPASAATEAQLDPSAVALIAQQLIAAEVIAGFALLGTVHIGGDAFTLSPPGVDPENLPGGLKIRTTDGGLIHLPADGSRPTLSGDALLQSLEVAEGARLYGDSDIFGSLTLAAAGVPNPAVAPTVETYYSDEALAVSASVGLADGLGAADWATIVNGQLVAITGGVVTATEDDIIANVVGVTAVGGAYYTLRWRDAGFVVREYDSSLVFQSSTVLTGTASDSGTRARIGNDGTNVVVAYETSANGVWSGDVVMTRYNPATWAVVSTITVTSLGGPLGGVYYGDGDGAFPAARWLLQPRDGDMVVYNTSGVVQASESFPRPYAKQVRGFDTSALPDFRVIDNAGVVRTILSGSPGGTFWWSYTWRDADTHFTLPSPETEHEQIKGASVRVFCSGAPQAASAGTHIANQIHVLAAATSGGTKNLQPSALPVGNKVDTIATPDTSSGGAPGSNNFAAANPGVASATTGGFSIDGDSNGSVGTGTFRTSVDARVAALAQPLDADLTAVAGLSPSNDDVIQRKAGAWANRTMAQVKTDLVLVKGDVGLGNVDNTADAAKPVSTAQETAIDLERTVTGTTANFNAIGNSRNTSGKFAGRRGFNTTANRPIWATGSTAAATWVYADGTTAHTPA